MKTNREYNVPATRDHRSHHDVRPGGWIPIMGRIPRRPLPTLSDYDGTGSDRA